MPARAQRPRRQRAGGVRGTLDNALMCALLHGYRISSKAVGANVVRHCTLYTASSTHSMPAYAWRLRHPRGALPCCTHHAAVLSTAGQWSTSQQPDPAFKTCSSCALRVHVRTAAQLADMRVMRGAGRQARAIGTAQSQQRCLTCTALIPTVILLAHVCYSVELRSALHDDLRCRNCAQQRPPGL